MILNCHLTSTTHPLWLRNKTNQLLQYIFLNWHPTRFYPGGQISPRQLPAGWLWNFSSMPGYTKDPSGNISFQQLWQVIKKPLPGIWPRSSSGSASIKIGPGLEAQDSQLQEEGEQEEEGVLLATMFRKKKLTSKV